MLLKLPSFITTIIVVLSLAACNTNPYTVNNLHPNGDNLGGEMMDTFTVICKNVYHDSVVANNLQTITLGTINNNSDFGTTNASIYAQFNLPSSQFNFNSGTVVDSIFILFPYRSAYGETTAPLDIYLKTLDGHLGDVIDDSKLYYSNKSFALSSGSIGGKLAASFSITDSATDLGKKIQPLLKIPITNQLFISDLIAQNGSTTGAFFDNKSFHQYLNGIYIHNTSSATNGLLQLSTTDANYAGLMVYSHSATADSVKTFFPINVGGTINKFEHHFANSKVKQLITANTNQDSIYVNGLAGVRVKIYFPGLSALKNTVINKAEIIFENVNSSAMVTFAAPDNLLLTRINGATGGEISLEDITEGSPITTLTDAIYYGGINTKGKYTFNISRYLQKLVNGTYTNDGFFIEAYNAAARPGQIVLGGKNSSVKKIKLKIIYTKIK
jgi:hypothetical protein